MMMIKKVFCTLWILVIVSVTQISAQTVTLFLTRHAEKSVSNSKDPELSDEGKIRAEKLSVQFSEIPFTRFFSTPYIRTTETLRPLASKNKKEISEYNPLLHKEFVEQINQLNQDEWIFISGHSNSIPDLLNRLTQSDKFKTIDEKVYGDVWILTLVKGKCVNVVQLKL